MIALSGLLLPFLANRSFASSSGITNFTHTHLASTSPSHSVHSPCIDAIKESGANFIIFCPGRMLPRGKPSSPPAAILTRGDPKYGSNSYFVSYEDAAHAMLEAAARDEYDGKHIQALTIDAGEL